MATAAKASLLFSPSPAPEGFLTTRLCKLFPTQKPSFPTPASSSFSSITLSKVLNADAVYTKLPPRLRTARQEQERDAISLLNERIRREHAKRDQSHPLRPAMDSEEADKYIQLVKEQQQRGLQKLKGDRARQAGAGADDAAQATFSYKVDPYTLRSGDYVVHRKVGIGRFVGIKFDVPKDSKEPIEYVFIEYADGMAKLPVKQASRLLYRYNLYVQITFLLTTYKLYIYMYYSTSNSLFLEKLLCQLASFSLSKFPSLLSYNSLHCYSFPPFLW